MGAVTSTVTRKSKKLIKSQTFLRLISTDIFLATHDNARKF